MSTNKMRISLVEKDGDIKGKVELHGNYAFIKEGFAVAIDAAAKACGMTALDLIIDLYHAQGKINESLQ